MPNPPTLPTRLNYQRDERYRASEPLIYRITMEMEQPNAIFPSNDKINPSHDIQFNIEDPARLLELVEEYEGKAHRQLAYGRRRDELHR